MTIKFTTAETSPETDRSLFLSASIPDPSRWQGEFDALAITDAVVAVARVFLTAGWRLVSAAHPTIAPLLLYVAAEIPHGGERRVSIYQSMLFEDVLPTATRRFEADRVGTFVWTEAAEGERPEPGRWTQSITLMRAQMLRDAEPDAAVFIGGMDGIPDEYALFAEIRPGARRYVFGAPGGAARELAREQQRAPLSEQLLHGVVFTGLARAILADLNNAS